jgi:predicted component of type VI protein secretion system
MQVKIRVLVGKNTGREIVVDQEEFIIGRGDGCHLRPKTDTVSRQHCSLIVKDGQVVLKDLGSKNGTLVNGVPLRAERVLHDGDEVKAGRLEFSMVIESPAAKRPAPAAAVAGAATGAAKSPAPASLKDAAARNIGRRADGGQFEDDDVSDWLTEGDTAERKRVADPETRQFRLDETDQITLSKPPSAAPAAGESQPKGEAPSKEAPKPAKVSDSGEIDAKTGEKKEKKEPGKLPKVNPNTSKDSRTAAEQTLKKFFNRR